MPAAPHMLTVGRALALNALKYPDKVAVIDAHRQLTYRHLNARANQVANAAMGLGLKKGDRVAVLLRNQAEWVEILFGLARAGIICVPVNFRFVAREIQYVVDHSQASAFILGEGFTEQVEEVRAQLPRIPAANYLVVGENRPPGFGGYEEWLAKAADRNPGIPVADSDCWYFGYTSGTTGFPKGTMISHRCRVIGAAYAAVEYGLGDADTNLIVMPLFHSNAIFFQMMLIALGGTVYIMSEFDPEGVLWATDRHGITNASLVPTMYAMMLNLPAATRSKYNVDSMRVAISSSSPLLTRTKEEIVGFFRNGQLHEFYGSTEAGFVTNLKPRDQLRKVRCVGQPFFGSEVRLLDADGNEVAPGEVGELFSRGPTLAADGYYDNPEATREAYRDDGWFSAGDMARADEEGYIYLVDRKKDLIISGGENIYPTEVEEVLSRHPAVFEAAVVGAPHELWGDQVQAIIRLREGHSATEQEIIEWCRGQLAGYKRPRKVEFWAELPKNPTGKILRRHIREKLWEGQERQI